jgi:hypothetical protein
MELAFPPIIRDTFSAALAATLAVGCVLGDPDSTADEDVAGAQEKIINGTVPAKGALMSYGVVSLGGCTGTLLTNRHVLTAHHCVRHYDDNTATWAAAQNSGMTATLEGPDGDQTRNQASILEVGTPWTLNARDYSILVLDDPMVLDGETNAFFNPIRSQADSGLLNQTVLCMGYGGTAEATPAAAATGFGTLTSANMSIDAVGVNTYTRNRHANVVGFGGDSGSACFLDGAIVGVQSTCGGFKYYDIDGGTKGVDDGWIERYDTQRCTSASADSLREWVRTNTIADATIAYNFVPAQATTPTVSVTISTPEKTVDVGVTGSWAGSDVAPRSLRMEVHVTSEPDGMMCPHFATTVPLSGDVGWSGACLGDGLVAAMLS